MYKLLLAAFAFASPFVFADSYKPFQEFDNQYNAGYSITQYSLTNGAGNQTLQQNQAISLDVERLFDIGVWFDVNANIVTATNSLGNRAIGTGQGNSQVPASQVPNLGGVNAKVGYAFQVIHKDLLLTPFVLLGRNTNVATSTIIGNNFNNITNDYFITGGVGGRAEYRIDKYILLYADQTIAYNWDQSGPIGGVMPQNNMLYTTTLGAKFNVVKNLQLGLNGFYNNFQNMATPPNTATSNGGNLPNGTTTSIYQVQSNMGMMITAGLTY
jgi:hypothetical protein